MIHTPGPWKVGKERGDVCCIAVLAEIPVDGYDEDYHEDYVVADVAYADGWPPGEDGKANAQLIAAAPEILKSLERCEFLLRRISEGDHRAVQNSLDAADEARAAIQKAKGITE